MRRPFRHWYPGMMPEAEPVEKPTKRSQWIADLIVREAGAFGLGGAALHAGALLAMKKVEGQDEATARKMLLMLGWEVTPTHLYDEEAVDGWRWVDPKGNECFVMGAHEEPAPVPDHILAALMGTD